MPFIDLPDRIPGIRAQARQEHPWYRFKNIAADEAELLLYDEIGGFGTYAEDFLTELKAVTAPKLRVKVNSPGGSVFEGVALANALRSHPAEVTVQVDGIAASIASVIAMAADRVVMQPQAMLMVHDASGVCLGNAQDMQDMAALLDKISDNIADAYVAKAGGTRDEWRQVMKGERWFTAEEAVEAGLADEVVSSKKQAQPDEDEPEMHRRFDLAAYGYTGPKQQEAPTTPPPVAPEQVTLTFNLGETFGPELVEMLRKTVARRGEPVAEPVPEVVDTASPVHHTATEDRPWDAGPNEKRLPSPMTVKTAKTAYAWYDDSQVEDGELPKSAAKLPHHEVSADGTPGAANLSGVRNALARLPQSDIPASQHDAVRRHLQAHLDDAKQADNETTVELRGEHGPELLDLVAPEPEQPAEDAWTAIVAHLTKGDADNWSALVSHLTDTTASSSAATEA
ncbi:head maturation protease, ClpP-related [Streptomyces sp. NPDC008240]|uniref:head maturation protease, ClpP-related n=1 Tax=Streptomyces sp. NPDC008240 TaxID=3364822 RepID=UPI0036E79BEE